MKKTFILVILTVFVMLMVGCQEGMINSTVSITSANGAGTKTVSVDILKDTTPIPGNKDGSTVGNNSKLLLGGGKALQEKLQAIVKLEDASITFEDKGDLERVTLSYSFSSIDDYNAKLKKLADGKGTLVDAVLKVDGNNVTFTEPTANAYNSMLWAIDAVYNDPKLFDKTAKGDVANSPITLEQVAKVYDDEIILNGTSKKVKVKENPQITTISATGVFNKTDGSAKNKSENPKTSDTSTLPYIFLVILSALAILFVKKIKFNHQVK